MSLIGRSLMFFQIDIKNVTEWPHELRYLRVLESLTVNQIQFPHLDINAFHGFEKTLKSLTLESSKLEKVPYAICNLSQLSSFDFRYNYHLQETKSSIFEPCGNKLLNVGSFYIAANNLNTFPDMFSLFPSLTYISAVANRHQYIDDTKIPFDSNVTGIHLSANMFDRIPYALNRMNRLTHVYLSQNRITTIEKPDLSNLTALTLLYLNGNPIKYIAVDAFKKNNIELSYLNLQNTHLDHVPTAVSSLAKLSTFILSGMPVDCTCDMSYLKHWNVSAVSTFTTKCAYTSETVKSFVMNSLQTCP
ncbi:leucine-rich repeat-containing protein 57-like [Ruditapes philippinarum]|uniref:leucine-rich repeat-containing protein 57-like n=1 Tax=Ruditapes philippinarum TaxID=129788 RepID=UPI00295C09C9|nr:leucine-rich repeat-containing protein 57-like [Ruditapes philippinarum]